MSRVCGDRDSFTLVFEAGHLLITSDSDGNTFPIHVGPLGLMVWGRALLALAEEQEKKCSLERANAVMDAPKSKREIH